MQLTRINEFTPAEGKEEELFAFLQSLVPYIEDSAGCSGVEVLRSEDEEVVVVLERWDSKEAHAASLSRFPKEQMQAGMVLIGGPPRGRFFTAG